MDHLDALFTWFSPKARVFFSGKLCSGQNFAEKTGGVLHILKRGNLQVVSGSTVVTYSEPTLMFCPRPLPHRFIPLDESGVDLVCAFVEFGEGSSSPLARALPETLVLPLHSLRGLERSLDLLFEEAFAEDCGRQSAIDRLTEYLIIHLLRFVIARNELHSGMLAGLSEPRLARAITAMHLHPELNWNLEGLAEEAGMSRARFAHHFRAKTGVTVMEYLQEWRIALAQVLLRKGRSVKSVASSVGYRSPAALTRTFAQLVGAPPSEWLKAEKLDVTAVAQDAGEHN